MTSMGRCQGDEEIPYHVAETYDNTALQVLLGSGRLCCWVAICPRPPQLRQQKRIEKLPGFGYCGVAVQATRKQLLALLCRGLRGKQLIFPEENGAVEWPEIHLVRDAGTDQGCCRNETRSQLPSGEEVSCRSI